MSTVKLHVIKEMLSLFSLDAVDGQPEATLANQEQQETLEQVWQLPMQVVSGTEAPNYL